jgi:hypothetical protein
MGGLSPSERSRCHPTTTPTAVDTGTLAAHIPNQKTTLYPKIGPGRGLAPEDENPSAMMPRRPPAGTPATAAYLSPVSTEDC